jgi:hypothetical protein
MPFREVGSREARPPVAPQEAGATFDANLTRLLYLGRDLDQHAPRILTLAPKADTLLARFQDEVEARIGPGGDLHEIGDWGGKLCGNAVRIAGLLHLADDPRSPVNTISAEVMDRALWIARALASHALAAFDVMADQQGVELAKKALGWIRRWVERKGLEPVSARDLARNFAPFKGEGGTDKAKAALKFLSETGWLRPAEGRGQAFEVNPCLAS